MKIVALKDRKEEIYAHRNLTDDTFARSGITWPELEEIYLDHRKQSPRLNEIAEMLAATLRRLPVVHSIGIRVKDPIHLIAKIIEKKAEKPERVITLDNYQADITDLIGVRVLHMHKFQWPEIHDYIIERWAPREITAHVRQGDPEEWIHLLHTKINVFKGKIRRNEAYRSVHYLFNCHPNNAESFVVEMQVRTIFEEAWGEIDHTVNYPAKADEPTIVNLVSALSGIAGLGDQLASNLFSSYERFKELKDHAKNHEKLVSEYEDRIKFVQEEKTRREKELETTIAELKSDIRNLQIPSSDKENLKQKIEKAEQQRQDINELANSAKPENDSFGVLEYRARCMGIL